MSEVKRGYVRPLDLKHGRVNMTQGSGGRAMVQLTSGMMLHEHAIQMKPVVAVDALLIG